MRTSLRLADEHHLVSIAFPAISTGVYGYPLAEVARVILSTLIAYLSGDTHLEQVSVCLYDRRAFGTFDETLAQFRQTLD